MMYRYRWLISLIFTFFLMMIGYIYVLSPALSDITYLQKKEQECWKHLNEINAYKTYLHSIGQVKSDFSMSRKDQFVQKNDFEMIAELATLIKANGLTVLSIKQVLSHRSLYAVQLQLTMQSSLRQFFTFLFALTQQSYPIVILDFSCQAIHPHLVITMNILLLKKFIPVAEKNLNHGSYMHHLFCPESGFSA